MTHMDSFSANYSLNAAHLLANVSPSLAALYATRVRADSSSPNVPPLSPLHCPRCAHVPVSTRIIANNPISKQRTTGGRTMDNTMHKTRLAHTRKSFAPSSNVVKESQTRGRLVRAMKSCANCGYVGAVASERSIRARARGNDYYENEGTSTSSSVPVVRMKSPELNVEAQSRSNSLQDSIVGSGAKLNDKVPAGPSISQTTNSAASTPTVPIQPDSSSARKVSNSAAKRQKKKKSAGLQELLARPKEQKQKKVEHEGSNLAAFLSGL